MAGTWFLIAFVAVTSVVVAQAATNHVVGGSIGWTVTQSASAYSQWASTQTFAVGDTLTFNFAAGRHNVIEVPKASFDACTAKNQIGTEPRPTVATAHMSTGVLEVLKTVPGEERPGGGSIRSIDVGSAGSGSSSGPAASPGGPPSSAAPSSLISSGYLRNSAVAVLLSATAAFLM
ncbi:uncharacterized protein A4U43_C08F7240 [Asparagus officinalis]|nr:uncharacterized protein A4U43_C08F7240 [Asparagus officinalis]